MLQRANAIFTEARFIYTFYFLYEAGDLSGLTLWRWNDDNEEWYDYTFHITDMLEKDFVMEDGKKVPISKAYQSASTKAFKEYFRAKMQGEMM